MQYSNSVKLKMEGWYKIQNSRIPYPACEVELSFFSRIFLLNSLVYLIHFYAYHLFAFVCSIFYLIEHSGLWKKKC